MPGKQSVLSLGRALSDRVGTSRDSLYLVKRELESATAWQRGSEMPHTATAVRSSPRTVRDTKHYAAALQWAKIASVSSTCGRSQPQQDQREFGDLLLVAGGGSVHTDAYIKAQIGHRASQMLQLRANQREIFMNRDLYAVSYRDVTGPDDTCANPPPSPQDAPKLEKPPGIKPKFWQAKCC